MAKTGEEGSAVERGLVLAFGVALARGQEASGGFRVAGPAEGFRAWVREGGDASGRR